MSEHIKFDEREHHVSWACVKCGKSGYVTSTRHEADPDVVARRAADDHQRHSSLCSSTMAAFGDWSGIKLLTARNGLPRWWRWHEDDMSKPMGLRRLIFLTCRFFDEATKTEREETEQECLDDVRRRPWPPRQ